MLHIVLLSLMPIIISAEVLSNVYINGLTLDSYNDTFYVVQDCVVYDFLTIGNGVSIVLENDANLEVRGPLDACPSSAPNTFINISGNGKITMNNDHDSSLCGICFETTQIVAKYNGFLNHSIQIQNCTFKNVANVIDPSQYSDSTDIIFKNYTFSHCTFEDSSTSLYFLVWII